MRNGLLSLLLLSGSHFLASTLAQDLPDGIPDDIYHCRDPELADENKKISIKCDKNSYEWKLKDLDEEEPPEICGGPDFFLDPIDALTIEDILEPCLHWAMLYGNLQPSASPSGAASEAPTPQPTSPFPSSAPTGGPTPLASMVPTGSPSFAPTQDPSQTPTLTPTATASAAPTKAPVFPSASPTSAPTEDPSANPTQAPTKERFFLTMEPIHLTFIWPADLDATEMTVDSTELRELTSRHILEALQAELGMGSVVQTNLILTTSALPTERSMTRKISGNVAFANPPGFGEEMLQELVLEAFEASALELYEFRLKIAEDPSLRTVGDVVATTEAPTNGIGGLIPAPDDEGWSPLFIAIVTAVAVALIAVCCFAYALVCRSSGNNRKSDNKKENDVQAIPALSTMPTNTSVPETIDPESPQPPLRRSPRSRSSRSRSSRSRSRSQGSYSSRGSLSSHPERFSDEEIQSVATSTYSYLNDDMDLSAAPSMLYSTNDGTYDGSGSDYAGPGSGPGSSAGFSAMSEAKKKGVLWSVLESLNANFGNEATDEEDRSLISALSMNIQDDDSKRAPQKKEFDALWRDEEQPAPIPVVPVAPELQESDRVGLAPVVAAAPINVEVARTPVKETQVYSEDSSDASDSEKLRSLLNQEDTNDAALFLDKSGTSSTLNVSAEAEGIQAEDDSQVESVIEGMSDEEIGVYTDEEEDDDDANSYTESLASKQSVSLLQQPDVPDEAEDADAEVLFVEPPAESKEVESDSEEVNEEAEESKEVESDSEEVNEEPEESAEEVNEEPEESAEVDPKPPPTMSFSDDEDMYTEEKAAEADVPVEEEDVGLEDAAVEEAVVTETADEEPTEPEVSVVDEDVVTEDAAVEEQTEPQVSTDEAVIEETVEEEAVEEEPTETPQPEVSDSDDGDDEDDIQTEDDLKQMPATTEEVEEKKDDASSNGSVASSS